MVIASLLFFLSKVLTVVITGIIYHIFPVTPTKFQLILQFLFSIFLGPIRFVQKMRNFSSVPAGQSPRWNPAGGIRRIFQRIMQVPVYRVGPDTPAVWHQLITTSGYWSASAALKLATISSLVWPSLIPLEAYFWNRFWTALVYLSGVIASTFSRISP